MELGRLGLLGMTLLLANPVLAATFVVTTEEDGIEPCLPGSCSLRAAVLAANATVEPAVIHVPAGHFVLSLPASDVPADDPLGGDLDVTSGDVTILGVPGETVIDAAGIDRVLNLKADANVRLYGLVITGGYSEIGGGIWGDGADFTVEECWITDNEAIFDAGGIDQQVGALNLLRSTVSGDRAGRLGGGIRRFGVGAVGPAPLLIENSTVSGNYAGSEGGALHAFGTGDIRINNSTLVGNSAGFRGDLVFQTRSTGPVFSNSLLEGDCFFQISEFPSSLGGNVGKDADFCFLSQATDLAVEDLGIADLAFNGGSTPTHALRRASPAVDHALEAHCPEVDQRGSSRPADGDGDGDARCDAGAYELGPPSVVEIPALSRPSLLALIVLLLFSGLRLAGRVRIADRVGRSTG